MPYQPCQMEPRCSIGRVISRKEVITLSKGFELKLDEKALRSVASDGIKKMLTTGELEYTCPNCGEQIHITGESTTCSCGFVLTVGVDELPA